MSFHIIDASKGPEWTQWCGSFTVSRPWSEGGLSGASALPQAIIEHDVRNFLAAWVKEPILACPLLRSASLRRRVLADPTSQSAVRIMRATPAFHGVVGQYRRARTGSDDATGYHGVYESWNGM